MIGECLESEQPFGVVLIKSGQEVGAPAEPYRVGTTASIAAVNRLEDGRMALVAIGEQRFRIDEIVRVQPYLVGQVQRLEDPSDDPAAATLATALAPALVEYLEALFAVLDQPREAYELPTEPERLSYVAGAVLQVGLTAKQALLELTTTSERLSRELDCLQTEREKLATDLRLKNRMGAITPLDTATLRDLISPN